MLSDYKIKQLGYIKALDTEEKPVTYCNIENDGIQISEQYLTIEKQKSIAVQHPNLLDEWDYNLNGRIDPEFISSGSNIKLMYISASSGLLASLGIHMASVKMLEPSFGTTKARSELSSCMVTKSPA